jgi:hypothetical protein
MDLSCLAKIKAENDSVEAMVQFSHNGFLFFLRLAQF